ncbi:MAG: hypothetical protein N4A36_00270 [Candidatus Gracilibacteria bacterium]|jgi:hypothetical protein|nr:hypothetical protein [Candidatus Gracilibacteria bacterium]
MKPYYNELTEKPKKPEGSLDFKKVALWLLIAFTAETATYINAITSSAQASELGTGVDSILFSPAESAANDFKEVVKRVDLYTEFTKDDIINWACVVYGNYYRGGFENRIRNIKVLDRDKYSRRGCTYINGDVDISYDYDAYDVYEENLITLIVVIHELAHIDQRFFTPAGVESPVDLNIGVALSEAYAILSAYKIGKNLVELDGSFIERDVDHVSFLHYFKRLRDKFENGKSKKSLKEHLSGALSVACLLEQYGDDQEGISELQELFRSHESGVIMEKIGIAISNNLQNVMHKYVDYYEHDLAMRLCMGFIIKVQGFVQKVNYDSIKITNRD